MFNSNEHVAYRYQPMFSYAFKGRLNEESTASDISSFFVDLLCSDDDFVLQSGQSSLAEYELSFPKALITHLVYKEVRYHHLLEHLLKLEPRLVVVGLIRNPCAVLHSWMHAPREFSPDWNMREEWQSA